MTRMMMRMMMSTLRRLRPLLLCPPRVERPLPPETSPQRPPRQKGRPLSLRRLTPLTRLFPPKHPLNRPHPPWSWFSRLPTPMMSPPPPPQTPLQPIYKLRALCLPRIPPRHLEQRFRCRQRPPEPPARSPPPPPSTRPHTIYELRPLWPLLLPRHRHWLQSVGHIFFNGVFTSNKTPFYSFSCFFCFVFYF